MSVRVADSPPGFCSCCFQAKPDSRFVTWDGDFDGAPVLDRETQSIAILPWNGQLANHDDPHICEDCWAEGREALGLAAKPQVLVRLEQEVRQLKLSNEHWRDYARRLEATLLERPEPAPGAPRRRPRAVAA